MAAIIDIKTSVPEFVISGEQAVEFFSRHLPENSSTKLLRFLNAKTGIRQRYSCIPDYQNAEAELYTGNQPPTLEERMKVYAEKIVPLAGAAIQKVLAANVPDPQAVTHLITVSCTGMLTPGIEILLAEQNRLEHAEKLAINFMGCYAGLKALKHARAIALAEPESCILLLSAELCSLHYYPPQNNEDVIANLLFGDGAAAVLVCGKKNSLYKQARKLILGPGGSAFVPGTKDQMSWNLSSTAFRMHLSPGVPDTLRANIRKAASTPLPAGEIDHWAVHPGGIRILQAVSDEMKLRNDQTEDSMHVLREFGNMSSCSILFILERILAKAKHRDAVFACAFGPGLTVETMQLSCFASELNDESFSDAIADPGAA